MTDETATLTWESPARGAERNLAGIGFFKTLLGGFALFAAIYILFWPAENTAWMTDWLYRLQEPIDGSPSFSHPGEWRNVTIGLLIGLGGWIFIGGIGDVLEAHYRRVSIKKTKK